MDADFLVENMLLWFGTRVDEPTYRDYLDTYIDLSKPDHVPSFAYRLFFSHTKAREFQHLVSMRGIEITNGRSFKTP